jgi:hypothetical protein
MIAGDRWKAGIELQFYRTEAVCDSRKRLETNR